MPGYDLLARTVATTGRPVYDGSRLHWPQVRRSCGHLHGSPNWRCHQPTCVSHPHPWPAGTLKSQENILTLAQFDIKGAFNHDLSIRRDTQALKNKIKSLEEEKERLGEKVERAKGAVDKLPDRSSYMDVCTSLRKQQDEEVNLSTAIQVRTGGDAAAG